MPGITMENHVQATGNGPTSPKKPNSENTPGPSSGSAAPPSSLALAATSQPPPPLDHITQGFVPFALLLNRAAQQCWNDLTDQLNTLAEINPATLNQNGSVGDAKFGASGGAAMAKRSTLLNFLQGKRAEFIKLLVLSQWSRRALDVSKLIDVQAFIRMRYDSYNIAIYRFGELKRDLIRAQTGTPDIGTALKVLSRGKGDVPLETGLLPPKPLTPAKTLRILRSLNRILRTRLILHDTIPSPFAEYLVHDGRVTFTVPHEFEVDLSVEGLPSVSQFYFIDMRLMFEPSKSIYDDDFFIGLEPQVNITLRDTGLVGCYNLLHNKALAKKVIVLHRQALDLLRNDWMDSLHVEVVGRTLIVRYWIDRPGPQSRIEISVVDPNLRRGAKIDVNALSAAYLNLKWVREGQEASVKMVDLNHTQLSLEAILSSVIALHSSRILHEVYSKLLRLIPFARRHCRVGLNTSAVEPGDCYLDVQLTRTKHVKVIIEPISGAPAPQTTPLSFARVADKVLSESLYARIYRLRCIAVREETNELLLKTGWIQINLSTVTSDEIRRSLPRDTYRTDVYKKKDWDDTWAVAHVSGANGESWWALEFAVVTSESLVPHRNKGHYRPTQLRLTKAHLIVNPFVSLHLQNSSSLDFISRLGLALTGIICMKTNHRSLIQLTKSASVQEPARRLELLPDLTVPEISLKFRSQTLPIRLQVSPSVVRDKYSILDEDISLSFEGLEADSQRAVFFAHGKLAFSLHNIASCAPDVNCNVRFTEDGSAFTLRFVARVGLPIITDLFYQLQQLEQAINVSLHLHHFSSLPTFKSFSRVDFIHPKYSFVRASVSVNYTDSAPASSSSPLSSASSSHNEPNTLASRRSPLARCYLSLRFERYSPYRRIEQSLTQLVRRRGLGTGLHFMLSMLDYSIPLLQSFYSMNNRGQRSKVRLLSRSPRFYVLIYSRMRYRFYLFLALRRGKAVWILRNATHATIRTRYRSLETELRSRIFTVKNTNWSGIGNTAILGVSAESIGALLSALDDVLRQGSLVPDNANAPVLGNPAAATPEAITASTGAAPVYNTGDFATAAATPYYNGMGSGMSVSGT